MLPKILNDSTKFLGEAEGRFVLARDLKGWKNSRFVMDVGSGKKEATEDIVRLETKVFCVKDGVPKLRTSGKFINSVDDWLEFAHGVTSPFFRELMLPGLMQKFSEG